MIIAFTTYLLFQSKDEVRKVLGVPFDAITSYIALRQNYRNIAKSKFRTTTADEVCLFLIWFRHYIPDCFLAAVFQMPQTNVRECRVRMLHGSIDF